MNKFFFTIGIWQSLPGVNENEKNIIQILTAEFIFAKPSLTSFTSSVYIEGYAIYYFWHDVSAST